MRDRISIALFLSLTTMPALSQADVLFDNGPLLTSPTESVLQYSLGLGTFGFGCQEASGNSVADDFVVPSGEIWTITSVEIFGYMTGAPLEASPFVGAFLQVWEGAPNDGGSVVSGDLTTNVMTATTSLDAFRVAETALGVTQRKLWRETLTLPAALELEAGTYWVQYMLAPGPNLGNGPWCPPVTIAGSTGKVGGNGRQSFGGTWGAVLDGTTPQDFPFIINGTIATICGDGFPAGDEACDDGNLVEGDGCDTNCTVSACGNGIQGGNEECDDGGFVDGDGCDSDCTLTACGNGIATSGEACDDGNLVEGDGCDTNCTPSGCGNGIAAGGEVCDDGNTANCDGCRGDCSAVETGCGDTFVCGEEACDDGNTASGDGCDSNCTMTDCGNGVVAGDEACDDGNRINGDGCDANCTVTACGNGIQTEGESCDDGNTNDCDGCRGDCGSAESGCGDGYLCGAEECDDGDVLSGDGCSSACLLEEESGQGGDGGQAGEGGAGGEPSDPTSGGSAGTPTSGGSAGTPTSGGSAGTPTSGGDETGGDGGEPKESSNDSGDDSGCGCRVPNGNRSPNGALLAVAAFGLLAARRRRQRA